MGETQRASLNSLDADDAALDERDWRAFQAEAGGRPIRL
jgi:hypothetical protein